MRVQLVLFYGICLALVTLSHHKRSLGSRLLILCRVLNFVQPGETFEVLVLGYQFRHHLFDFFLSWKGLLLLAFFVYGDMLRRGVGKRRLGRGILSYLNLIVVRALI